MDHAEALNRILSNNCGYTPDGEPFNHEIVDQPHHLIDQERLRRDRRHALSRLLFQPGRDFGASGIKRVAQPRNQRHARGSLQLPLGLVGRPAAGLNDAN